MKRFACCSLRAAVLVGLTLMLSAPSARGQELADLEFMSGCWRGSFGSDSVIEEYYSAAGAGLMVGATRFIRSGQAVEFEFARIEVQDGAVVLTPYPSGRESEHGFRLTSFDGTTAIFEAPEHDFPKRIIYRRDPDGGNTAAIDGGSEADRREWKLMHVPCPGAH